MCSNKNQALSMEVHGEVWGTLSVWPTQFKLNCTMVAKLVLF